ncbi:amidohydrolase [Pontibacter ummariensis]|uniref:Amidohydrolase n=1 Tax=Pontibacter ummariensis TaxID=1610492 RepID=A0A239FKP6_9BACT|nr:amidohydrolase [Pontibacter ummariensis]PRY12035.1 amidohydrolase [Pontibacter ummariensis]SNS57341.1 amidohydrolase [Pontibacter ummariensis]
MHLHPLNDLEELKRLRRQLHQYPEVSGQEQKTARTVAEFVQRYKPDQVLENLGGTGLAVVFKGEEPEGPVVLFRAELDALPIQEANELAYTSVAEGKGHLCGHDGHMSILMGLGSLLHQHKPKKGKVILLYQPAEETGAGAYSVLQDERFRALEPDFVFALHNLPGVPLHQVVVREGVFAAASTGMIVELHGKSSHAAEPEKGRSPGQAMAELLLRLQDITAQKEQFQDLTLLTVVHARLGDVAFGTNPGFATVMATLRSYRAADFKKLKGLVEKASAEIAQKHQLKQTLYYVEEFETIESDSKAVQFVRQAANKLGLAVQEAEQPFRWSEDFGRFTQKYRGAFFGLGSGLTQAQLHHANFDFPDALIRTGAALFYTITQDILDA